MTRPPSGISADRDAFRRTRACVSEVTQEALEAGLAARDAAMIADCNDVIGAFYAGAIVTAEMHRTAAEAASAARVAELVEALAECRAVISGAQNEFGKHPAWTNAIALAEAARAKAIPDAGEG